MRIMIVNAYGHSNRGDSVLLDECLAEIRDVFPNASIGCALYEGIDDARLANPSIRWSERIGGSGRTVSHKIAVLFRILVSIVAVKVNCRTIGKFLPNEQYKTLCSLFSSDIVVSAPGGYIHDTNFSFYISLIHIYLANCLRKKVLLAPQSIGPIRGRMARALARRVLNDVEFICPREGYTRNFLLELQIDSSRIVNCGDSAFWNDDVERMYEPLSKALLEIGVDMSVSIFGMTCVGWTFPYSSNPQLAYTNYIKSMADIADAMYSKYGLIPIIFNQVSGDIPTALAIQERAHAPIVVDTVSREPRLLRGLIERSTVFLGTRFHSCIFALVGGRPTHAIAYLPKTSYILEDLRLPHRHVSIEEISSEAVVDKLSTDIGRLPDAEAEVRVAVAAYRASYRRFRDVVRMSVDA